jgi:fructosamine-3-kinase
VSLPAHVERDVSSSLEELGLGARIVRATRVGGGCINHGTRVETDAGRSVFLKWNAEAPAGMFEAEVDGLRALRAVEGVRAPEPLAHGAHWLLLEHVETGRERADTSAALGRMLAELHAEGGGTAFGWPRDNWIGSLPQANPPTGSWGAFWRDRRIAPQLERARRLGHLKRASLDRLLDVIPSALADVERPELVHGDLWGGNWLTDAGGEPVLIDPAVYRGHGEVDLAMSELFGGFDGVFYDAYHEARGGASREYAAYRRDLYQLYYLLVHVNLFGSSYEAGARRAAERVVAALR